MSVIEVIFWGCFLSLFLVWIGYPIVLSLIAALVPSRLLTTTTGRGASKLSIVIAAHNEQANIGPRVQNILESPPRDFEFEVVVMSDHSGDRTVEIVNAISGEHPNVKVFEACGARGRASAHNQSIEKLTGDIIIFTDAETRFDATSLDRLAHAFDDPKVGFASGKLLWINRAGKASPSNFSIYWLFEVWLRRLETHLGICAVGSGPFCAVRKELYRPIPVKYDVDSFTPYDVVQAGAYTVSIEDAVASDYEMETVAGEFRSRVRMTSKNLLCLVDQLARPGVFKRPLASAGLVFHKLGRWLTPVFAILLLLTGLVGMWLGGVSVAAQALSLLGLGAVAASLVGGLFPSLPVFGSGWSFLVANAGFLVGIYKVIVGGVAGHYKKEV